ncbi:hypothetical protein V8G54_023803 [Vigna mungo]|uniref:Uncharacterized protein n=1 Tax=Vigna mungo TaxID=3915 RepID=A0AAQ3N4Z9_VIGMU
MCVETPSRKSSELVGSPTTFINEKVTIAAIKVLDEALRAISGFQGTEDLSDDKLMDIPFAYDCIRTKKVSSAPSYDVEEKDDVIVNFEACDSGIQQWCEAIEKHMPLILCHSSAMKALILEDWFKGLCSSGEGMIDAQDKGITDRKRVMICSALQSLVELYRDKQQDAIAEKFEKLKNNL